MSPRTTRIAGLVAFLVFAVLIFVLPGWISEFRAQQFAYVGIYLIALLGLNILTGYTGQISLGHGAFMAIGGYTTAILMAGNAQFGQGGLLGIEGGMKDVWTIPIAGLVAGLAGLAFGLPALRLAGLYLALATFAIAVALPSVVKRFEEFSGGGSGVNLFGLPELTAGITPVEILGRTLSFNDWLYYLCWTIALALLAVAWLILRGRTGRAFRAVRDSETPPPHVEEEAFDATAAGGDAEPVDQQLVPAEPDAAEPAEPLPRLEDLTAESDLSAFLRKGVPKALKSAALRKMWSLDPAIRDYIGPSEYAWDFNQPGSMAGFGPLDDAGEHVAEFLSRMSGGMRTAWADAAPSPEAPPAPRQNAGVAPDQDASAAPDGPADAASPAESVEPPPAPAGIEPDSPDQVAACAEPSEAAKPADLPRTAAPPRHGRAMPR